MTNPYSGLPDHSFWKRAVAAPGALEVDPVAAVPFTIAPDDRIATAGSCFAQHISRTLSARGYNYLVTETDPTPDGSGENYGVFPARFGNIYTVRQLLQLFLRAYGLFRPADVAWSTDDGTLVDPFRPRIQAGGFGDEAALLADRGVHLAAVREMFESCDVFIFTLGLTEGWVSRRDGAVFPLAPGVCGGEPGPDYAFHNFTVDEMLADLNGFLDRLREVNARARVILTVSPVPLIATYEDRHVLLSNTYSKAALRVTAEMAARRGPQVMYFPAYEIITGPQAGNRFFAPDLRSVTEEGVARVMSVFSDHLLGERHKDDVLSDEDQLSEADLARFEAQADIVCDEDVID